MTSQGTSQQSHLFQQLGPLGLVILLHVAAFFALQNGLSKPVSRAEPREIVATLIAAQSAPAPTAAAPAPQPEPVKPQAEPKPERHKPQPKKQVKETPKAEPTPEPTPKSISKPAETAPAPAPAPASPPAQAAAAAPAPNAAAAAGAPAGPPGPAQPKLVTSGVEYIQPPSPVYPAVSRRLGEEGTVTLRVLVNERGRAEQADIHKSSGVPRLDEAARQAVLRAVFKPYTENGGPIPYRVNVPISFQLDR
ncbi:outer membrane transport energization protein TonB [Paucimonas lemoignei]|uniref:Outer membrane transport energization protein TonB n=1 Tax=Paucimonas lemoignei TaxID=29443 RepID=A0A4R3HYJ6_PAULE|nr:energy transducer TonB [Paucimonas lemoignei]TCS38298.1 outer membrane transport energization protein TonB [Paucimonas lemoignei]